jgi:hypothetical protein
MSDNEGSNDLSEQGRPVILLAAILDGVVAEVELKDHVLKSAVAALVDEFLPRSAHKLEQGDRLLFNISQECAIDESLPVRQNPIDDGDILMFGSRAAFDGLHLEGGRPLNFEGALAAIQSMTSLTFIPTILRCQVTDGEFEELLQIMMKDVQPDERFGGRQLLAAMIRTVNHNLREIRMSVNEAILSAVATAPERVRKSLENVALERSINQLLEDSSDSTGRPRVRYLCNAASVYYEPVMEAPGALVTQVKQGLLEVGQIVVDTRDSIDLPGITIPDGNNDRPRDDHPTNRG